MHRIAGSEVLHRTRLLPGYGAIRIADARVRRWGWSHTGVLATLTMIALTVAGTNGLLP